MKKFTMKQKAWFKANGFRLLKTKADREFGDKRHLLLYEIFLNQTEKDPHGTMAILVMKYTGRYSVGRNIVLPLDASPAQLARAAKGMRCNSATLFSELNTALKEVAQRRKK